MIPGVLRSDRVLAGVFVTLSLVQALWIQPVRSPWFADSLWFGVALAVVSMLPLAWRRSHPLMAAGVGSSLWWVPTDAFLFLGYVCTVLLFFSVGRWSASVRGGYLVCLWGLATGTFGFLAIDLGLDSAPGLETVLGILGFWFLVLGPYAVGRVLTAQEDAGHRQVQAARESARREATAEERSRIVRELHDVVGHEVTLMSIQSEAAAQALHLAPERAAGPITAVRETAHRASRELREILHLLGSDELSVVPDQRGLAELADRAARLGIANRLVVTGEPWPDAPRQWLGVNRIVQECLTNAGKHARGELVDIAVDWSPDGVLVRAGNTAPGGVTSEPGRGMAGMAERARLLGGTFEARHADGRFEVSCWLPAAGHEQP